MNNKEIFSRNLQYYMVKNGVTRQDIAQSLNLSYFTVSSWLTGNKYPRMDKVEMLANYFGIQKSDLIEDMMQHGEHSIQEAKQDNRPMAEKQLDAVSKVMGLNEKTWIE